MNERLVTHSCPVCLNKGLSVYPVLRSLADLVGRLLWMGSKHKAVQKLAAALFLRLLCCCPLARGISDDEIT